jgi:hypothetical protein
MLLLLTNTIPVVTEINYIWYNPTLARLEFYVNGVLVRSIE